LPHAQKLAERFAGDERVRVVAVATAFEKEEYPFMADEEKIKARLKQDGQTFPVMRDKDEKTVRILGLQGSYGTPLTLVLDAEGIVRWHGFNATEATAKAVDETVDSLLASFFVPVIPDLAAPLRDYDKGAYGRAYKAAQRLIADERTEESLRTQAQLVIAHVDAAVPRLTAQAQAKRTAGHPAAADEALAHLVKAFKETPGAAEAEAQWKALKADAAFQKELKLEKELDKQLARLEKDRERNAKSVAKKLDGLLEDATGTPLETRVREARAALD
jgi:hypothetical protein